MQLELTHPWLLLLLALLAVLFFSYRKSLLDFSRGQRLVSLLVRTAILVLLVLSAAGLTALYPTKEKMLVFLVDESRSIDQNARQVEAD